MIGYISPAIAMIMAPPTMIGFKYAHLVPTPLHF